MRKILVLAAGAAMIAAPAVAQNQGGLVNVNVSDISVDLNRIISDNNITAQVPVNAIVSVPVGIAANVCNVSAAVLARQAADAAPCNATNQTASDNEIASLARVLQRQQR
jgi:hypothetical protein